MLKNRRGLIQITLPIRRVASSALLGLALLLPWATVHYQVRPITSPPYENNAIQNGMISLLDLWLPLVISGVLTVLCCGGLVLFWAWREQICWRWDYLLDAVLLGIGVGEGLLWLYVLRMVETRQEVPGFFETHRYAGLLPGFWLVPLVLLLAGAIRFYSPRRAYDF